MPALADIRGKAGRFEPRRVEEPSFLAVIGDAARALESIRHVFIGGLASSAYGRPRWTRDADLLVHPDDASRALEALQGAGFEVEKTDPSWLYKGMKNGTLIDVLFRSKGDVFLDDEMFARSRVQDYKGLTLRLISPEDLIVLKAIVHEEALPHHWHDGLGVMSGVDLDWDYLVSRARRHGARRVLAMLVYADANGIAIPPGAVGSLYRAVYKG